MTSRSKSVDLDRSATSLRVVTASPSEMKLLSKAANEVPRPGHFGPDRVKALEATVEDLQNLIRTQASAAVSTLYYDG